MNAELTHQRTNYREFCGRSPLFYNSIPFAGMKMLPVLAVKFSVLFLMAAIPGCRHVAVDCPPPRLVPSEIMRIANEEARERGILLEEFNKPNIYYEFLTGDCSWTAFYVGKGDVIGRHFYIKISDRSGEVE